jgi:hypothetical protein
MVKNKKAYKSMILYKPFDEFVSIKVGMTGRLNLLLITSKSILYTRKFQINSPYSSHVIVPNSLHVIVSNSSHIIVPKSR